MAASARSARDGLELLGTERIGTGQMSQSHRVTLPRRRGGPRRRVVVKLASDDPIEPRDGRRAWAPTMREIAFYRNLAARIGGPLARCHLAEYDDAEGWFTLVLEDVVGAGPGRSDRRLRRRAGAALALRSAGPPARAGDRAISRSATADYLNQPNPLDQALLTQLLPAFLERYGERDRPSARRAVRALRRERSTAGPRTGARRSGSCTATTASTTCCSATTRCTVVDWQTVSWGPAMRRRLLLHRRLPAASRTAARTSSELRRAATTSELLAHGRRGLRAGSSAGRSTAASCFHGIVMTIAASMIVERTERGDEMFMTWFERNAPAGARPRRGRAAARAAAAGRRRRCAPIRDDEGSPRARSRGAVERELVLRRGQRRRRARPVRAARSPAQPGRRACTPPASAAPGDRR